MLYTQYKLRQGKLMPKSTQTNRNIGRSHDNTLGNSIYDFDTIRGYSVNMGVVCNDKNNA
jgi:hypothetical protein